jgi:carbonic anhydrase
MASTRAGLAALLMAMWGVAYATGEHPGHGTHWGYKGDIGPGAWTKLKPEFSACAGKNQSPIDVARTIDAQLPPIRFHYKAGGTEVVNNGHTVQVNYEPGNSIWTDGIQFELKQFHFHSPSENQVKGKPFPLEAHLVHVDKDGNLAVVAVLFEIGPANPAIGAAWKQMPKAEGKAALPAKVSANGLLPANRDHYRYNGSLTTPPCTEGVRWIVMKRPMTLSKEQLDAFKTTLGFDNNRPVQPSNARAVLR